MIILSKQILNFSTFKMVKNHKSTNFMLWKSMLMGKKWYREINSIQCSVFAFRQGLVCLLYKLQIEEYIVWTSLFLKKVVLWNQVYIIFCVCLQTSDCQVRCRYPSYYTRYRSTDCPPARTPSTCSSHSTWTRISRTLVWNSWAVTLQSLKVVFKTFRPNV